MAPDDSAFSADVALGLLADSTRRAFLRELITADNDVISVDELTSAERPEWSASKIELYHTHLPKLAEAGVIDWNRDSGTVQYRPSESIESVLRTVSRQFDETEPPPNTDSH